VGACVEVVGQQHPLRGSGWTQPRVYRHEVGELRVRDVKDVAYPLITGSEIERHGSIGEPLERLRGGRIGDGGVSHRQAHGDRVREPGGDRRVDGDGAHGHDDGILPRCRWILYDLVVSATAGDRVFELEKLIPHLRAWVGAYQQEGLPTL